MNEVHLRAKRQPTLVQRRLAAQSTKELQLPANWWRATSEVGNLINTSGDAIRLVSVWRRRN